MGHVLTAPKRVDYFGNNIKQVSLGEAHTVALDTKGSVFSFGWGELGQLGVKFSEKDRFAIHRLPLFDRLPCRKVSVGAVFSMVLT